ncbi:MAG: SDR family oxidoreductase [Myxococcales bacterium]|nr:SDR family oxidoreductase [Myxococcales bacterium]
MARILIAGCGYVGSELARIRAEAGDDVFGLRRNPIGLPAGVVPISADLAVARSLAELPEALDAVVYAAAPGGRDDAFYRTTYVEGLRNLLGVLGERPERPRVIFVSSTAVYGQTKGEWVDESSPTEPGHFSGVRLLEAEALLRESEFPGVVVRFGGIYGPRRTRLLERVRQGRVSIARGAAQYTNRIHRDDCAGALHHLIDLDAPDDCYLGVDHEPADEADVFQWLAGVLGAPAPLIASSDERRESRRGGNKRCRNDRLVASGYTFRHPSFRDGYTAILEGGR